MQIRIQNRRERQDIRLTGNLHASQCSPYPGAKTHPGNTVQKYVMRRILRELIDNELIKKDDENA